MASVHIGLIGGIGPAATEFYYHHLSAAHSRARRRLELTLVNADAAELIANVRADARDAQAEVFVGHAKRLQAAGADLVVVTSIAGHFCAREFEVISPLPVLGIVPAVRAKLDRLGLRRVGLLGTRIAMASRLYQGLEGFDVRVPEGGDFAATDREYLDMAMTGGATERHREFFFRVGAALHAGGAEAVLLAGTDLCLVFDGRECGFPTVDCALAHVEAITQRSLG
jgi:aspartate racemase